MPFFVEYCCVLIAFICLFANKQMVLSRPEAASSDDSLINLSINFEGASNIESDVDIDINDEDCDCDSCECPGKLTLKHGNSPILEEDKR